MSGNKETIEDVKVNIRSLLITAPRGMLLQQFCNDYKTMIGQKLPCQDFQYDSPEAFLKSMPDVVTLHWVSKFSAYQLTAVGCEETRHIEKLVSKQKVNKKNSGLPKRMPLPRFSKKTGFYERPKKQALTFNFHPSSKNRPKITDEAKHKIIRLIKEVNSDTSIDQKKSVEMPYHLENTGASHLSNKENILSTSYVPSKVTIAAKSHVAKEENLNISAKANKMFKSIPEDCVLPGATFSPQTLPPINCDNYTKVLLVNFINPDEFCIQLKGQKTSDALDILLQEMCELYSSPKGDVYGMRDDHISVNTVCASLWTNDGMWYRSKIIGLQAPRPGSDKVESFINVFHVDYGSTSLVLKSEIRYLKKEFMNLPSQAIRGHMPSIKPISNSWTANVSDRIVEKYCNQQLYVEFLGEQKEDTSIPMWLCDSSGEKDVFLAQLLIDEGYAVYNDANDLPQSEPLDSRDVMFSISEPFSFSQTAVNNPFVLPSNRDDEMTTFIRRCQEIREIVTKECQNSRLPTIAPPVPQPTSVIESKDKASLPLSSHENCNKNKTVWGQPKRPRKRFVKRLNFCDGYSFRIINLNDVLYVASYDISKILWNDPNNNYLDWKLQKAKLLFPSKEITQSDHPELFHQLRGYETNENTPKDNEEETLLKLFHLDDVPRILDYFGHPSFSLRVEIEHVIINSNPKDCLWEYFDFEYHSPQRKEVNNHFERKCIDDLQETLTGLKYKKLILLRQDPDLDREDVKKVEALIKNYEERVAHLQILFKEV